METYKITIVKVLPQDGSTYNNKTEGVYEQCVVGLDVSAVVAVVNNLQMPVYPTQNDEQ